MLGLLRKALSPPNEPTTVAIRDAQAPWRTGSAWTVGGFVLRNAGTDEIVLTGAKTPAFDMTLICLGGGNASAAAQGPIEWVQIGSGQSILFGAESYHLLMVKPARPLAVGDVVPVTLFFASGQRMLNALTLIDPTAPPSDQISSGR